MGRDVDSGVFGEVLKEEKARQDQAKRDQQKAGGGSGAAGRRGPPKAVEDAFDQLSGSKPDPDVARSGRPGRVKLGS